jgi:hypothetical protein
MTERIKTIFLLIFDLRGIKIYLPRFIVRISRVQCFQTTVDL